MKKVNKAASVLFAMILATSFISGCGSQSKSESSASATSSVSSKSVSESSAESSKEASVESSSESSAESSKEDSKAESSTASSSSTVEEKKYTLDDAIAYGKIIYPAYYVSKVSDPSYTIGLDVSTHIAILSTDDPETYDFIYKGYRYKIAKKCVELFPEDYVPDFSEPFWFTVSDIL